MKGHIQLGSFIKQVKKELIEAQDDTGEPFYALDSVELEVSFVLDTSGKATGKLLVVELEGESKATQTHKVTLSFTPVVKPENNLLNDDGEESMSGAGGGGGSKFEQQMLYDRHKDIDL